MAIKIDLPKEILVSALDQAAALRSRNIKAATNPIIKEALEKEHAEILKAKTSIEKLP